MSARCLVGNGDEFDALVIAGLPRTEEKTVARPTGTTSAQVSAGARKPAPRVAASTAKVPRAASRAGRPAASSSSKSAAAVSAPKLNKEELRAYVEKLERANARLRTKGRDTGRAGKAAADRIAELEGEVARLERQLKRQTAPARLKTSTEAVRTTRKPRRREIDPGDAVPPGVAVEEPAPPDKEAEAALAALDDHIPGEGTEH